MNWKDRIVTEADTCGGRPRAEDTTVQSSLCCGLGREENDLLCGARREQL
jgi:hypothetical protein